MAKRLALLLLITGLSASVVFAESSSCQTLKSGKDRDACHARQAVGQTRLERPNEKMIDPIEQMKLDDDRLAKRLQRICRGC